MEDNSETHMDTDVSSTTEDVVEVHQVTNSYGNLDMITVVVEEIKEENVDEKNANCLPCENSCQAQKNENTVVTVILTDDLSETIPKEGPQKLIETTAEPAQCQEVNESTKNGTLEHPQVSGTVDSTNKADSPNQDKSTNSPHKVIELNIDDQKSTDTVSKENEMVLVTDTDEITDIETNTHNEEKTMDHSNNTIIPVEITVERESSIESNHDNSEKEHSKSISRELKSLINSAKESKIISECTQLTTKMRKPRTVPDSPNLTLNTPLEAARIQGTRRNSNLSLKSNCSEKSDKNAIKRSMRSQNPEFVSKVKQFLNSVTGKCQKDDDAIDDDLDDSRNQVKEDSVIPVSCSTPKKRKIEELNLGTDGKLQSDPYCWRCHWAVEQSSEKAHIPMLCTICPRSYHFKCLSGAERNKISTDSSWVCPDCLIILHAESSATRSPAMKKISLGMLCDLLKFALERMMEVNGVEPFMTSVDRNAFPDYEKYVVRPMDLSLMKSNIAEGIYGSTEAFSADAQWILHNSIIFNTLQSKLTSGARALVRSCRAEMGEIEACPECYSAAHARRPTWFTDVCSTPHILLWAKLKGFPYWPAKGMSVSQAGLVDVRFFGAHDRAWVPAKDCFLYSEKDPNSFRTKRQDILDSMQEAEQHIRNISKKYAKFVYPSFKTPFDPSKLSQHLKMMIPTFEGEVRTTGNNNKQTNLSPISGKKKSRSNSKCSKNSEHGNDGDTSEAEDPLRASTQNGVDNGKADREVDDSATAAKEESINVEVFQIEEGTKRKRRRSSLEEAVITILDSGTTEKRKRVQNEDSKDKTSGIQEPSSSRDNQKESEISSEKIQRDMLTKQDLIHTRQEGLTVKDDEPSSSSALKDRTVQPKDTTETPQTVNPIRITINKLSRHIIKSNIKDNPESSSPDEKSKHIIAINEQKPMSSHKQKSKKDKSPSEINKEDISKSQRRRKKGNRSLSDNSVNSDRSSDKSDRPFRTEIKLKENPLKANRKSDSVNVSNDSFITGGNSPKLSNDRYRFDDDTSLAIIARESTKTNSTNQVICLPTISNVVSLSTAETYNLNQTKPSTDLKSVDDGIIEADSDINTLTQTSAEDNLNVSETAKKLQQSKKANETMVGRVGVRAFARMTSQEKQTNNNNNSGVQVEIKAEPIDLDEPDRHMEKMDLMTAFKLRPVNPSACLREVRINKVVVTPLTRRAPTKPPEIRPRAKKTFPQPKKPEDCQLNGKNSMVYIPIQPAMTQAPVRFARPINANGPVMNARANTPITSTASNVINTVTPPLVPIITSISGAASSSTAGTTIPAAIQSVPTVGQVPTTVHTVPLMTSVNGQWMFSLQPVMSVGAVDNTLSSPAINGLPERRNSAQQPISTAGNGPANDATTPGDPPRLQQRPALLNPLDINTPGSTVPAPPSAGPLTSKINQSAVKLADFFRTLLEDSLDKLDDPAAQTASLKLQLEQLKWKHQQQIEEINHNQELVLTEMRTSFEKEKQRALHEARRIAQVELDTAVKQTKTKQWCSNCNQEAQFYCCWNTSYCDYPCQRAHWSQHFSVCTQQRTQDGSILNNDGSIPPESRLKHQPDNLPKNSPTPALRVGGTVAARLAQQSQQNNNQKTSLIMSMVEDNSGNKTVKCVGTYSGAIKLGSPSQVPPLLLNKQLLNDETNKKVVTSGGYLIVGAGNTNASVAVTQSRRMHTTPYYT